MGDTGRSDVTQSVVDDTIAILWLCIMYGINGIPLKHPRRLGRCHVRNLKLIYNVVHYALIFAFWFIWYSRKRFYRHTECINTPASAGALPPAPLPGRPLQTRDDSLRVELGTG